MSHENEAIIRKSTSDEKKVRRNTRDILEVLVNNIKENIDVDIEKNEQLE